MDNKTRYEYIKELRNKMLLITIFSFTIFIITFIGSKQIINLLLDYYQIGVFTLSPSEGISSMLNISFFITTVFFIPMFVYQFFSFSKELIPREFHKEIKTKTFMLFILGATGFTLGVTFFSKIILSGLATYNIGGAMWSISGLLSTVILLGGGIALAMESILIIPMISKIGLVEKEKIKKSRPFIIVAMLIISALITPPDLMSQMFLMIPLYGSFEIGILLTKSEDKLKCLD